MLSAYEEHDSTAHLLAAEALFTLIANQPDSVVQNLSVLCSSIVETARAFVTFGGVTPRNENTFKLKEESTIEHPVLQPKQNTT